MSWTGGTDQSTLTAGLTDVTLGLVTARTALLEARRAEEAGDLQQAAEYFSRVPGALDNLSMDSPLADSTRAAALAGIGRVNDDTEARHAAVIAFEALSPAAQIGPSELADWASSLEQDDPRAAELYLAATRAGGAPSWGYRITGLHALRAGNSDEALAHLERAVLTAPLNIEGHVGYAQALELAGRRTEAAAVFTVAAVLLAVNQDHVTARDYIEHALALDDRSLVAQLVRGDLLRVSGDRAATDLLRHVAEATEDAPKVSAVAMRALARTLEARGRRQDAVDALMPLANRKQAAADDLLLLAELQSALGQDQSAEGNYSQAIAIDPESIDTAYALVRHYLRSRRLSEARQVVEEALRRSDRAPELHVLRGELRLRAGESGAPDDDVELARLLGLDGDEAWATIGAVRADHGDRVGALQAYERAVHLRPDKAVWHARRGSLALEVGDVKLAVAELEQAAHHEAEDPEIHQLLAEARLRAEDRKGALSAVNAALRLAETAELLGLRGRVERDLDDDNAAARDLRASIQLGALLGLPAAELYLLVAKNSDENAAASEVVDLLGTCGDAEAVVATARQLRRKEHPRSAVSVVSRFLATEQASHASGEQQARLLAERGIARFLVEDSAGAEADLRQAIGLDPELADAQVDLGIVLAAQQGRGDDAVTYVRKARALDPGSDWVAYSAVMVIEEVDGAEQALAELDGAIAQIGAEPELVALRARLLVEVDVDGNKAAEALEVANTLGDAELVFEDLNRTKGRAFTEIGRFSEAVNLLSGIVSREPTDTPARISLARSLIGLGRYPEAIEVLRDIDANDPLAAMAVTWRGLAHATAFDRKAARQDFLTALGIDQSFSWPRQQLVQVAWELNDRVQALEHLQILLDDPELHGETEVVRLAWLLDRTDIARSRLDQILATEPGNREASRLRAYMLIDRGEGRAAIEAATKAVDPDSAESLVVLADAYLAAGQPEDALLALRGADHRDVQLKRAEIFFTLGQADESLSVVEGLLAQDANRADGRFLVTLCDLLMLWNQQERAVSVLGHTLSRPPRPDVLRAAGDLLSSIGDFRRAVKIFEHAGMLDQHQTGVDQGLAWAYSNVRNPPLDKILMLIGRVLEQRPQDPWLIKMKADALLLLDHPDAISCYDRALERLSEVTSPRERHSLAAWCYYRKGDVDRAVDHLLHATSIPSSQPDGNRLDLALSLLAADRPTLARQEYERALDELRKSAGPLPRLGLLRIGLVDLNEASARLRSVAALPVVVGDIRKSFRKEINACRPAFEGIKSFLGRLDRLVRCPG